MKLQFLVIAIATIMIMGPIWFENTLAQVSSGDSPFERKFGDVKFLDAYFGTDKEKIEVNPGDRNVPFTLVLANVGTQDITGIKGELSLPLGFSPTSGSGPLIEADFDSTALAGEIFKITFFVDISEKAEIKQYPGSAKIDYSRLRESGARNTFFDFNFKVTGKSVINMRALDPFLYSLKKNHVTIEISNNGTAPISGVEVELQNAQGTISSTSQSVTKVENVVILNSNWEVGQIAPGTTKSLEFDVYVPGSMSSQTLRTPMQISYFNAHGEQDTLSRIVDFYVKGLIDVSIYDVNVIDLSGKPTIIGEIINEGNENALFGFVTLEPLGDSNIKKSTQFIDEIELDSPVPFNILVEFDGEPKYGEHDIRITVRYKDSLRDEVFKTYDTTVLIPDVTENIQQSSFDLTEYSQFIILGVIAIIGGVSFSQIKKRKKESNKPR
ncbi:MAG: COG1361 S-layer family protein [Nitrosopumilaceae archaeon]